MRKQVSRRCRGCSSLLRVRRWKPRPLSCSNCVDVCVDVDTEERRPTKKGKPKTRRRNPSGQARASTRK